MGGPKTTSGGMKVAGSSSYLPLYHTNVDAVITGPLVEVAVVQVFKNTTPETIEAVYSFPISQNGAVFSFEFHIDKRIVKGVIKEKEEAKADYAKAKAQGKTASLLEQDKENLFTMSVANIKPGEMIEVHMRYQEKLPYDDGEFRFVFPLVAPEAYANAPADSKGEGRRLNDVSINVKVQPGIAIHPPRCLVHDVTITQLTEKEGFSVQLNKKDKYPNKDFVLAYSVVDRGVSPMVYLQRSEGQDGTFLVVLNPPDISTLNIERAPSDFVFVMDRSASMRGGSLEQAQNALAYLLEGLSPTDGVQVLSFDHEVESYDNKVEFSLATPEALATINDYVRKLTPRGGTELELALYAALQSVAQRSGREKTICLVTDAAIADHTRALQLCDDIVKQEHTRLFVLGVGPSVDRLLVSKLASKGMGVSEVLLPGEQDVRPTCERFRKRLLQGGPLINNIQMQWKSTDGRAFSIHSSFPSPLPSLFSGQPLQVFGRFTAPSDSKAGATLPTLLTITGDLLDGSDFTISKEAQIPLGEYTGFGSAVQRSWARWRIDHLTEQMDAAEITPNDKDDLKHEIIALSIQQTLASKFTSFVAVEHDDDPKEEEDQPVDITLHDDKGKEVRISDLRLRDKASSVVLRASAQYGIPASRTHVRVGEADLTISSSQTLLSILPKGVRAFAATVSSEAPPSKGGVVGRIMSMFSKISKEEDVVEEKKKKKESRKDKEKEKEPSHARRESAASARRADVLDDIISEEIAPIESSKESASCLDFECETDEDSLAVPCESAPLDLLSMESPVRMMAAPVSRSSMAAPIMMSAPPPPPSISMSSAPMPSAGPPRPPMAPRAPPPAPSVSMSMPCPPPPPPSGASPPGLSYGMRDTSPTGPSPLQRMNRPPSAVTPASAWLRRDTQAFITQIGNLASDVSNVSSATQTQEYPKDILEWAKDRSGIGRVDLAFVIDETGSMGSWISQVQSEVLNIIQKITDHPMCKDVRIGLVGYRDHPPQDSMVAEVMPFTSDKSTITRGVQAMYASGGGDGPECMTDGMYEAVHLDWRPSAAKAVVVITDAPPHGLPGSHGDGFPNGCPCGRHWYTQAASLREMGVACYTVGCGLYGDDTIACYKAIAHVTRGVYVPLSSTSLLVALIVGAAEVEIDRQRVAELVYDEIQARKDEFNALFKRSNNNNDDNDDADGNAQEESFISALTSGLKQKNAQVRALRIKDGVMGVEFGEVSQDDVILAVADLRRSNRIDL